jgi:two-component system NtrC family sensor kinase
VTTLCTACKTIHFSDRQIMTAGGREQVKDIEAIREELKTDFTATIAEELIPGILHNLANPLNGIMGRTRLLQKRMADHVRRVQAQPPSAAQDLAEGCQKAVRDVDAIAQESDRLFHLFRSISGKFYAISPSGIEPINLSLLVEAEMAFADFYLDFKHEVTKKIRLKSDLPEINGQVADFSLFLTALLRYVMDSLRGKPVKEFSISTAHDDGCVLLSAEHSGGVLSERTIRMLLDGLENVSETGAEFGSEKRLFQALAIMKNCGARIDLCSRDGFDRISLRIPCAGGGTGSRD